MAFNTTETPYLEITSDGKLSPFGFIVDFKQSKFDVLPNVKETSEELINVDGIYCLSTKYEPRLFYIVSNSDIMTITDRDNKISEIGKTLSNLKKQDCLFKYRDKLYKVRLGGQIDIENNTTWLTVTISLKANNPYGYSTYQTLTGAGTAIVGGDEVTYPIFEITNCSGATTVTVNGTTCYLGQTLLSTDTVLIDCEKQTAILNGTTNILDKWVTNFPTLNVGNNTISISQGTLKTYWKDKYISL